MLCTPQSQSELERTLAALINELDLAQIHSLLAGIHDSLVLEPTASVRFALFLNFKRMVIDQILKIWRLEQLRTCLPALHPMECIYMILNSTFVLSAADTDAIASMFGDDLTKAYTVFRYIVLWMNWKVHDPSQYDERFYEAYFKEWSKEERKRVMSSIGSDILQYIEIHPEQMLQPVVDSFAEIVPMLEGDHITIFWKFYKRLQSSEHGVLNAIYTLDNFYSKLCPKQIRKFLLYQHGMAQTIPQTPLNPTLRRSNSLTAPITITDVEGWELLCAEIHSFIAHCYETSPMTGDRSMLELSDLLLTCSAEHNSPFHQEISVPDKIIHFSRDPAACLISLLQSSYLPHAIRPVFLRECVLHWALFEPLKHTGFLALLDLTRRHGQIVETYGAELVTLHMDTATYPSLSMTDSLERWIQELGETHPYSPPLVDLLTSVRQVLDQDDLQPMDTIETAPTTSGNPAVGNDDALTDTNPTPRQLRHPILSLKTQIHQMPSMDE
eukprot:jgi/Hompol1/3028/HPOL_003098-RA